jgi:tRNA (cmo5U34)-methyltransferase
MFERRYGAWLASQRDEAYRDTVLAYIAREDTPAPVSDQLRWLREAGFAQVDLLHARDCFAALGAVKAAT